MWFGLIWFRTGNTVRLLWTRQWIFGLNKWSWIYWPAERLAAFQEELGSMESCLSHFVRDFLIEREFHTSILYFFPKETYPVFKTLQGCLHWSVLRQMYLKCGLYRFTIKQNWSSYRIFNGFFKRHLLLQECAVHIKINF